MKLGGPGYTLVKSRSMTNQSVDCVTRMRKKNELNVNAVTGSCISRILSFHCMTTAQKTLLRDTRNNRSTYHVHQTSVSDVATGINRIFQYHCSYLAAVSYVTELQPTLNRTKLWLRLQGFGSTS